MSTCKECIHYEVCEALENGNGVKKVHPIQCGCFKPKVDYALVKHGKWISELVKRCDWRGKERRYYQPNSCSLCHKAVLERTNFCPDCGAKMDGKEEK